nr:uncharacterized protein LOC107376768 [Nothobranchius furzeri]
MSSEMMLLLVIFCGISVIRVEPVTQDTGVRSVAVGENITLHCFCDSLLAMHVSWYRQTLGRKPEILSVIYKYGDTSDTSHQLENNPRFSVQVKNRANHLLISDTHLSDSASYFCGSSYSNTMEFGDGVFLSVAEPNHVEILQEPTSEMVQLGDFVTFKCAVRTECCHGEQIVYWFKDGYYQQPLHTQTDQCQPVSGRQSPSLRCLYLLQKNNLSYSDAGTYYCSVASCGQIVLGSGSKLFIGHNTERQAAQIKLFVWLSVIRAGILWAFIAMCLLICACQK